MVVITKKKSVRDSDGLTTKERAMTAAITLAALIIGSLILASFH